MLPRSPVNGASMGGRGPRAGTALAILGGGPRTMWGERGRPKGILQPGADARPSGSERFAAAATKRSKSRRDGGWPPRASSSGCHWTPRRKLHRAASTGSTPSTRPSGAWATGASGARQGLDALMVHAVDLDGLRAQDVGETASRLDRHRVVRLGAGTGRSRRCPDRGPDRPGGRRGGPGTASRPGRRSAAGSRGKSRAPGDRPRAPTRGAGTRGHPARARTRRSGGGPPRRTARAPRPRHP